MNKNYEVFFPKKILDFSSQYSSDRSRSYGISNVCAGVQVFPKYGDSTDALVFRTYGPWWKKLDSHRKTFHHRFSRPDDEGSSQDFIELEFEEFVEPGSSLQIIETYNPGTLEKVFVGRLLKDGTIKWFEVWKFAEPFSVTLVDGTEVKIENGNQKIENYFPNDVETMSNRLETLNFDRPVEERFPGESLHSSPPAAHLPRIAKIPLGKKFDFPIRFVRLEFDHRTADYYIEIDTICLSTEEFVEIEEKKSEIREGENFSSTINFFDLPFDVVLQICSFLDLRSLIRFSSTCRTFRKFGSIEDSFFSVNLKTFWNRLTNESLDNFFVDRCRKTRFLSLSWSKNLKIDSFSRLVRSTSENLTNLQLASCRFLNQDFLCSIVENCPNLEILNLENCSTLRDRDFLPLKNLSKIRAVNFYGTLIDFRTVLPLIDTNRRTLEFLNLGNCRNLIDFGSPLQLAFSRCFKLKSFDYWRNFKLTPQDFLSLVDGLSLYKSDDQIIEQYRPEDQIDLLKIYRELNLTEQTFSIGNLNDFQEIDLGWTNPPAGFISKFVQQIGKNVTKIFLTACRQTTNEDLFSIGNHCPQLKQLDVLGNNNIEEAMIEHILRRCPHLEFLDLSFCSKISASKIDQWRSAFSCSIKRSYAPVDVENVKIELARI